MRVGGPVEAAKEQGSRALRSPGWLPLDPLAVPGVVLLHARCAQENRGLPGRMLGCMPEVVPDLAVPSGVLAEVAVKQQLSLHGWIWIAMGTGNSPVKRSRLSSTISKESAPS